MMTLPRTQTSLLDVRAKEGGKETAPFPWSLAVHHQSLAFRARLCHAKNEAPEEEADDDSKPNSMREILFAEDLYFSGLFWLLFFRAMHCCTMVFRVFRGLAFIFHLP